jgi:hypothetical protein
VKRLALKQGQLLLKHLVPAVIRPLHSLWNEIIGFLFLCFAIFLGTRLLRALRAGEVSVVVLVGFGFLICTWYGITSFLKARRISRS